MSLSGHTVVCIFSTHFQLVVVQAKFYSVEKENYRKQITEMLTSESDASGEDCRKVQVVSAAENVFLIFTRQPERTKH